jgi:hypothetical protein
VGYTRITPIGLSWRPTHQFHAGVSGRLAYSKYFFKCLVGKNRAYKTELHDIQFYRAMAASILEQHLQRPCTAIEKVIE